MKLNTLAIGIFLTVSSFAHEINFFEGTWDETKQKANTEHKFIMLDCYTDWCGWCKVMDRETFKDSSVVAKLNSEFISARREMEKTPEGRSLAMKYHVRAFPTYLFFSQEGKLIYIHEGFAPAEAFLHVLTNLQIPRNIQHFPGLSNELDPGFPAFYKALFDPAQKMGEKERKQNREEAIAFLDKQTNLYSEISWSVLWIYPSLSEKYDNWIFQHADTLRHLYGAVNVNRKLSSTLMTQAARAAEKKDKALFEDAAAKAKKYGGKDSSQFYFSVCSTYYRKTENWTAMNAVMQSLIDTGGYEKYGAAINDYSWTLYEKCDDTKLLTQAADWMQHVCEASPEYASLDTYAALLYKLKRYDEAEVQALKAIETGNANKENVSATEALLVNIRLYKKPAKNK
jgi:thioredoxin-related protein